MYASIKIGITITFDSLDVKNIRVKLNECYYPDELQNLHTSEGNYAIMYEQYQDYKKGIL